MNIDKKERKLALKPALENINLNIDGIINTLYNQEEWTPELENELGNFYDFSKSNSKGIGR